MAKIPYEIAKRGFKRFPDFSRISVATKQRESVPLEQKEKRALGLSSQYRTADRMLIYDRPVNRSARGVTKPRKKDKVQRRKVAVYLVKFTSKITDEQVFLKIGISNELPTRFDLDFYRYDRAILNRISDLTRKEALRVERQLHALFRAKSYVPKLKLLSRGNSECFVYDDEIISTVGTAFDLLREEKKRCCRSSTR